MATYAFPKDTREADFWLLNGLDCVWFSIENFIYLILKSHCQHPEARQV